MVLMKQTRNGSWLCEYNQLSIAREHKTNVNSVIHELQWVLRNKGVFVDIDLCLNNLASRNKLVLG